MRDKTDGEFADYPMSGEAELSLFFLLVVGCLNKQSSSHDEKRSCDSRSVLLTFSNFLDDSVSQLVDYDEAARYAAFGVTQITSVTRLGPTIVTVTRARASG